MNAPLQTCAPRCGATHQGPEGLERCELAEGHNGHHVGPLPPFGYGTHRTRWWDPTTHPYRVSWSCQDGRPGMYGWRTDVELYATEELALEALRAPFGRGVVSGTVTLAVLDERGERLVDWRPLWTRKRQQQPARARARRAR